MGSKDRRQNVTVQVTPPKPKVEDLRNFGITGSLDSNQVLTWDGEKWTNADGGGDVTATSAFGTDNVLIRSDGTGKGVQSTGITIDDSDTLTSPGDLISESFIEVRSTAGYGVTPGSDQDVSIVTLGVTGFPKWGWDESEDEFTYNKPINIGSTIGIAGMLDQDDMSSDSATHAATQQSIKAYVDGNQILSPTGSVVMYGAATAPTGWLICDGSAVSRTTYSDLFDVIGTTYGAGNGTTTFNLPDVRQRFPMGQAASGTGSTLGGTGGAIDHFHYTATGHDGTNNVYYVGNDPVYGSQVTSGSRHVNGIPGSGSGAYREAETSNQNPPFITFKFIIKT